MVNDLVYFLESLFGGVGGYADNRAPEPPPDVSWIEFDNGLWRRERPVQLIGGKTAREITTWNYHPAGTCNWADCQRQECKNSLYPTAAWPNLDWCQYCDGIRDKSCMRFTDTGLYICTVCQRKP